MEEENKVEEYAGDDPKSVETTYLGLAFIVLLVVTVVAVVALTYRQQHLQAQKNVLAPSFVTIEEVQSLHQQQLDGYLWIDPANGKVTSPIEGGRARVLEVYGEQD